jgi:hypothetical protein
MPSAITGTARIRDGTNDHRWSRRPTPGLEILAALPKGRLQNGNHDAKVKINATLTGNGREVVLLHTTILDADPPSSAKEFS